MNDEPGSVLVVIDATAAVHPALGKAGAIAEATGATLRLFSCDHDPRLTARLFLSPDSLSAARADFLRRRRQSLERLAEPWRQRGVTVEIEAAWDSPLYAGVLTEISLMKPDLVVKDTSWHAPLGRGLFSHADWRLLQACPVPLLLAKPRPWAAVPRVAAAIDPGHPGDPAAVLDHAVLSRARKLAGWMGAGLRAVHAYLPVDPAALSAAAAAMPLAPPAGSMGDDMRQAAAAAVAALLADHDDSPGEVELIEGAAVDVLPGWCLEREIDVLVVGVVSRSRLVEAVLGSTAEHLLERIPSDLLAIRAMPP